MKQLLLLPLATALLWFSSGCSIRKTAVNKIGDALASSGTTFAADDDPQLVREAVPFSLKLIESLLAESPNHRGLLLAAASGFTQYAYAFVQEDADEIEDRDVMAATALGTRAKKLYLRARNYGLRGIEVKYPGFEKALRSDPRKAAATITKSSDVPFLYWTAAPWGAAISISKDDPDLIADQLVVEALIDRALELDEKFGEGAIHGFLISYEQARQGAPGDAADRSQKHFDRAVELSKGNLASPFVAFAESVSVGKENRKQFETMLKRALMVDPNARPEWKLENLVMQRRAQWLLDRADRLFLDEPVTPEKASPQSED
jgi:predicted anti-sigma-YlaC factor YlaD